MNQVFIYDKNEVICFSIFESYSVSVNKNGRHGFSFKFDPVFWKTAGPFIQDIDEKYWDVMVKLHSALGLKIFMMLLCKSIHRRRLRLTEEEASKIIGEHHSTARWFSKQKIHMKNQVAKAIQKAGMPNFKYEAITEKKGKKGKKQKYHIFGMSAKSFADHEKEKAQIISGVYMCVNNKTGHKRIGEARNIHARIDQHRRELNSGKKNGLLWQAHWNEYGEDSFEWFVYDKIECSVERKKREKELIIEFDTANTDYGYNRGLS